MIGVTASDEIANDAPVRSNVVRLAAAQALTGANSAVIFATGSIVGATLAPDVSFATVPISMYVLETHLTQERNKVQAFNDFLVFGMMAIGSFSSGQLLANYGWSVVNLVVYPPVLLGLVALAFTSFARQPARLRAVDEFPEPSI